MTEQKIEKAIIDKLSAALSAANIDDVQIMGAWQPATVDAAMPKGLEKLSRRGILSVKAAPRSYEMYTGADGSIAVTITLNVRAETDANGVDYLAITNAIAAVLHSWNTSYSTGAADFNIADEFLFSGFRLDGGDCGLDVDNTLWTWQQNCTIQGIFTNPPTTND